MTSNGTAWREQTFFRVNWIYIAAPVTLALLSLIFVAVTMTESGIKSNRYKVWKSSSLSTLLALSEESKLSVGGLRSLSEIEGKFETTHALLGKNKDGNWVLQTPC